MGDGLFQLFEEGDLCGIDDCSGGGGGEPPTFIDFGERLLLAGAAGPFDLEGIAGDGGGVEVAGEGPGKDTFASFLPDRAQGQEMSFEGEAGLFAEFTDGGIQRGFIIFKFSFGYGPAAGILVFPEGATGMDEEYFQ